LKEFYDKLPQINEFVESRIRTKTKRVVPISKEDDYIKKFLIKLEN
jgi:hypothetical protein